MLRRHELTTYHAIKSALESRLRDADANMHSRKRDNNAGATRALHHSLPTSPISPYGISALGFPATHSKFLTLRI